MTDFETALQDLQARADSTIEALEQDNRWAEALELYRLAGAEVDALPIPRADPQYKGAYREAKRVRAYLYMREANALRALGRPQEAAALGEKEVEAAWASGDMITIARSTFSLGGTCLANGEIERGLKLLDDAKGMFEHGQGEDFQQGLGWWHIIQADIRNNGMVNDSPEAALALADKALELLRPLKNWPGVARAHAARAQAYEKLNNPEQARLARAAEQMAQSLMRSGREPDD
jgi:tetratricopeptide (TPR) repeat protein